MSAMPIDDLERDCASFWICVLLQMCVQPRRETWHMSCDASTCSYVGPTEGTRMNASLCRVDLNQSWGRCVTAGLVEVDARSSRIIREG
jgi:hypothetical protein